MKIKKLIITALILALPLSLQAAQKTIHVGTSGSKKSLDTNFSNAHDNFTEIYGHKVVSGSVSGNTLTLTLANASTISVNVASLVNTDAQTITNLSLNATTNVLTVALSGGNTATVDLTGLITKALTVTASGFNGNLATTDDTLQEIAQKVDDLVIGSGGSMTWPSVAGIPYWTSGTAWGGAYTLDTDLSSVSANDDTIPSAKATKAALDGKQAALTNPLVRADLVDTPADSDLTHPPTNNALFDGLAGKQAADADLTDLADGSLTGSKVSAASETAVGVIERATTAEVVTGSATDLAVTPAGVSARMAAPGAIGGTTPAAITATSVTVAKSSGVAGDFGLYEANSTDTHGAGFRGPASLIGDTAYRAQFPNAGPSASAFMILGASGSGAGTAADPYIHAMPFIPLAPLFTISGSTLAFTSTALTTGVTIPVVLTVAASDETTAITTGAGKRKFRAPYAFTLTGVRCSVGTAPTGANLVIDVNETGTTSVLATKVTIEATEFSSVTATTQPVIGDSTIADNADMSIDFDTVGSSVTGAGVKCTLYGTRVLP